MRLKRRTSWKERTRPSRATLSGESPTSSVPFSFTAASVGADEPGEQVEHGRLAGAVRPDERGDGALAQLDVEVLGGDDAAEALGDAARLEHDRCVLPHVLTTDLTDALLVVDLHRTRLMRTGAGMRLPHLVHLEPARAAGARSGAGARSRSPRAATPCGPHHHQHDERDAVDDELVQARLRRVDVDRAARARARAA